MDSQTKLRMHMAASFAIGIVSTFIINYIINSSDDDKTKNDNEYIALRIFHSIENHSIDKPNKVIKKRLHLVRHAQGYHNEAGEKDEKNYLSEEYFDSELTHKGVEQCNQLNKSVSISKAVENAQALIVSPMMRTLQTASISFSFLKNKIPFIANEACRECTGLL